MGASCGTDRADSKSKSLTLRFEMLVDGQPLRLGTQRYTSPTGSGEFVVEDFKIYISNIGLRGPDGDTFVEEASYHLLRLAGQTSYFDVVLDGVAASDYGSIELAIGVDPVRNLSIESLRDLNPNNQMAWNWDVGYKFVLFEGTFYPQEGAPPIPLVFHVGYSESYRELSFNLNEAGQRPRAQTRTTLTFDVELMEMFRNPWEIDFSVLPSVKFDKADAKMIADNYANMLDLRE